MSDTASCRAIAASLATWDVPRLWRAFLGNVRVLEPFWTAVTRVFADSTGLPDPKGHKREAVIASAFGSIDDWRNSRTRVVKARRNEIDSAISFLRNTALNARVRELRVSPAARNAAGPLRLLLATGCRSYADHQIPELLAGALIDIAAVRTLFPFDLSDLVSFHPGHGLPPPADPMVIMLRAAGCHLGVTPAVDALLDAVSTAWR